MTELPQVSDALSRQFDDAMDKYLGSYMDGKVEGSEGCSLEDELDYDDEDWLMEQLREEDDYDDDDDDDGDYEEVSKSHTSQVAATDRTPVCVPLVLPSLSSDVARTIHSCTLLR